MEYASSMMSIVQAGQEEKKGLASEYFIPKARMDHVFIISWYLALEDRIYYRHRIQLFS